MTCPCQHDDRPRDVACSCVDECPRRECRSPEHQPPLLYSVQAVYERVIQASPQHRAAVPVLRPLQDVCDRAVEAKLAKAMELLRYVAAQSEHQHFHADIVEFLKG